MGNSAYLQKLKELEGRIVRLEDAVDAGEVLSSVELLKLQDELYKLKLAYVQQDIIIDELEQELAYYKNNEDSYVYIEQNPEVVNESVNIDYKHSQNYGKSWNKTKNTLRDRISFDVSKMILPLMAAILILLSSVVFIGAFWENIPDFVKPALITAIGVAGYIFGLNLYNKHKLFPYIILGAIGSAVIFIGIASAGIVFKVIGEIPTILAIVVWAAVNLASYFKLQNYGLLGVTELGIIVASFLVCDKAAGITTESAWFMWVVLLILALALAPVMMNYIQRFNKYTTSIYNCVTHYTSLICLAMYMLANSDRHLLNITNNALYLFESSILVVTACIIGAFLTRIGKVSRVIIKPINHIATLIIMYGSLFTVSWSITDCIEAPLSYILCLVIGVAIALRSVEYRLNYTFVIPYLFGMIVALFDSVFEASSFPLAIGVAIFTVILGILMVAHESITNVQFEKVVTAISIMLGTMVLIFVIHGDETEFIYFAGIIIAAALIAVFVEYKQMYKVYIETSYNIPIIIYKVAADILGFLGAISFGSAIGSAETQLILAVTYILILRALDFNSNKLTQTIYNIELYIATVFVFIMADSCNSTIAVIMVGINLANIMMSTLIKDGHGWTRVGGAVMTFFSIGYLEYLIGIEDIYIINISVLLMSAVMILLGFIFKHKTVRITSLVSLIGCTISLVYNLAGSSSTIEKAVILLLAGVFVLGISVIYAKFERKYSIEENNIMGES